jgi:chemotaxis signal transduction protein
MVCFRAGTADYCLPVTAIRSVRTAEGMVALPAPRPDVTGLVPGNPPLSVVSLLGSGSGRQILVLEADGTTFGLLVDEVSGLRRIDEADIRPAPGGQDRTLISGTVELGDDLILVADPAALAERL